MELAAELLPRIAPQVAVPRAVREGPETPRLIRTDGVELVPAAVAEARRRVEAERTLAIIAPGARLGELRAALDEASLDVGDVLTDGLSRQITLLSAEQAKGLEFDHVLVFEPVAIAGPDADWARLYVALTRATRTLSVVFSTELPFEESSPNVDPGAAPDAGLLAPAAPAERLGARFTEALMQAEVRPPLADPPGDEDAVLRASSGGLRPRSRGRG